MKSLKLVTHTLLAAALCVATAAIAQPGPRSGGPGDGLPRMAGPHGPGSGQHLAEVLGLTAEQQTAVAALREGLHTTVQPLFEQQRTLHESIRQALDSGSRDAAALGQLMLQVHDVRQQVKAAHDAFEVSFAALLTPEQKAKWEELKAARGDRGPHLFGHDMGMGMGPGPGMRRRGPAF